MMTNGPALGIFSNIDYVNESKQLFPGDILIMYTDGVIEMDNPKVESFGIVRLKKVLTENWDLPAADLIQQVISYTKAFSGFQSYLDDFTLLIVKKI